MARDNKPQPEPKQAESRPPRRVNPLLRLIINRVFWLAAILVLIVGLFGGCALFAPTFFAQTIQAAQSAGLRVYTIVLGATGNPALQVVTYSADVSATTTVTRDMGILSLLYGESANVIGTVHIALGADLKNNQFGILSCDMDVNSLRSSEQRAPLAGAAFDPQKIKQAAYSALEKQAAQLAIGNYWAEARKRLTTQFTSWALGVKIPESPTLTDCPFNGAVSGTPTP